MIQTCSEQKGDKRAAKPTSAPSILQNPTKVFHFADNASKTREMEGSDFVRDFFGKIRALESGDKDRELRNKKVIYHADILLQRRREAKQRKSRKKRKALKLHVRKMSHRKLKKDGFYDLQAEKNSYRDFLPIHQLWCKYFGTLTETDVKGSPVETRETKRKEKKRKKEICGVAG